MYTPDEILLIRDLLVARRKEVKTDAAKVVLSSVLHKTDDLMRQTVPNRRKDAA